jgi:hypothetical protein
MMDVFLRYSHRFMTTNNVDVGSGGPNHLAQEPTISPATDRNAVQSNKFTPPEAKAVNKKVVTEDDYRRNDMDIDFRCKCGHGQEQHDRVQMRYFYPCRECDCDLFSLSDATRIEISRLADLQYQKMWEENRLKRMVISS